MLRFTTSFFIVASALFGGACLDQGADLAGDTAALTDDGRVCPAHYEPVCGADGQTYSNACYAARAQIAVVATGECEEPGRVCPAHYDPVCGADGQTYSNACLAARAQVAVVAAGECAPSCACPALYDPVCGEDGQTYSNGCAAGCGNAAVAYRGECGASCGGFRGLACADDQKCRYAPSEFELAPYADAAGTCVSGNYCDAASDCGGFPNVFVPGAWTCDEGFNACGWQTASGWLSVPGWRFSSGRPYRNNARMVKTLTLPEGATQGRIVNLGAFALETGYDRLVVERKDGNVWTSVSTLTGSLSLSQSTVLLQGGLEFRLTFTSDANVKAQGFDLVAEFTRH